MYEVQPLITSMHLKHRDSWEQSRMIAYIIAQVNSRKKLNPTDIIKFAWDNEEEMNKETSMSNEDIERLRKKAKEYSYFRISSLKASCRIVKKRQQV